MCVDLHTHSTYSDGTATPTELVQMAEARHLKGLAITDHDTIEGCKEALAAGKKYGIPVLTGLEISCLHGDYALHMLGYGVAQDNPTLNRTLQQLQEGRKRRNDKIVAKLNKLGIAISTRELQKLSPNGQTGRPHIARILMKKKIVSGMDQAFRHYLGKGKAAYCKRFCFSAAETIDTIHAAGGAAVLAHPGILSSNMLVQERLIQALVERHLDGIEVYHPVHSKKIQRKFLRLAEQHHLLVTGGSDYHGGSHHSSGLTGGNGTLCPPDTIMDELRQRIKKNGANTTPDTTRKPTNQD